MRRATVRGRHQESGFSLPEMLTVLVLVLVIASAAVPKMSGYIDSIRTRRALDRVVGDVAYARLLAIQQGRQTAIRFGAEGTYTLDTMSVSGVWSPLRTVRLRDEYRGVSLTASADALEFTSRGLLRNGSDGFIWMQRGEMRDSIFVSQSGRVYRDF